MFVTISPATHIRRRSCAFNTQGDFSPYENRLKARVVQSVLTTHYCVRLAVTKCRSSHATTSSGIRLLPAAPEWMWCVNISVKYALFARDHVCQITVFPWSTKRAIVAAFGGSFPRGSPARQSLTLTCPGIGISPAVVIDRSTSLSSPVRKHVIHSGYVQLPFKHDNILFPVKKRMNWSHKIGVTKNKIILGKWCSMRMYTLGQWSTCDIWFDLDKLVLYSRWKGNWQETSQLTDAGNEKLFGGTQGTARGRPFKVGKGSMQMRYWEGKGEIEKG